MPTAALHRNIATGAVKFLGAVGDRQIQVVASDGTLDRAGDILEPLGCRYSDYLKYGTVLAQHDSDAPIARTIAIDVSADRVLATIQFPAEGINDDSDRYYALVKAGIIGAVSVGFLPIKYRPLDNDKFGLRYTEWELVELSLVSVPANPAALITGKGLWASAEATLLRLAPSAEGCARSAPYLPWGVLHFAGTLVERQAQLRDALGAEAYLLHVRSMADTGTPEGRQQIVDALRWPACSG